MAQKESNENKEGLIDILVGLFSFRTSPEKLPYSIFTLVLLVAALLAVRVPLSVFEPAFALGFIFNGLAIRGILTYGILFIYKKKERFVKTFTAILCVELTLTVVSLFFSIPIVAVILLAWFFAINIFITAKSIDAAMLEATLVTIFIMLVFSTLVYLQIPPEYIAKLSDFVEP